MEKDTKLTFALAAFLLFLGVIFYILDDTGMPQTSTITSVHDIEPAAGDSEVIITIDNESFIDVKKDIDAEILDKK